MSLYKVVLVTGASAGFGYAIAKTLAESGYKVIAAARRLDRLEELASTSKGNIYPLALDVTDENSVSSALKSLPDELQKIDVLVNNAGLALGTESADKCLIEDWKVMIDTNVLGLVSVTRAVIEGMIKRNRGYIINLGSTAGAWPYRGGNVYGGTKAFVEQFTRNLRTDLHGTAVKASVIKPGLCSDTEFSNVRYKGDDAKAKALYEGTESIRPQDIADMVLYLVNTPAHLNINAVEMMPVCQTYGGLSVKKNLDLGSLD